MQQVATMDFDFLLGDWAVRNRRRNDYRPEGAAEGWSEFESKACAKPILGGSGVVDTYSFPEFPGRGEEHGFALRLVDVRENVWRIWWASSSSGGSLDSPLVGRFWDGAGLFTGGERYRGSLVLVRTRYDEIRPDSLCWEQAFSFDEGKTYEPNWTMHFQRLDKATE